MIYALLGTGAVGALGIAILSAMYLGAKKALVTEQAAHSLTRSNLAATTTALAISENSRTGEVGRLEAVIAGLKKELETLESEKSSDPDSLRARLERLSGG